MNGLSLRNVKIALYIALFLVASTLFFRWEAVNAPAPTTTITASDNVSNSGVNNAPNLPVNSGSANATANSPIATVPAIANTITVNTPLMQIKINPQGGTVIAANLSQYKQELHSSQPFQLLDNNSSGLYYVVSSGVVGSDNSIPENMLFSSKQTNYTLGNEGSLNVNLTWQGNGFEVVKTFTFLPNSYTVGVNYTIQNTSKTPWSGRFYGELTRNQPQEESSLLNSYTNYTGAAISSPDDHYEKIKFAAMAESSLNQTVDSGWVAMLQHYFITAWVPSSANGSITQFSSINNGLYSIGLATPSLTVAPGATATTGATLYMGPAISDQLNAVAPYLGKTVDYGWLWFISDLLFSVMSWIHNFVGNWGLAIILVTVLIKLIFYPLSAKSYLSMAKMRELQPKVKALREKFGDDRQKLGMATMELYRKEKVNPLGGCLPILVQIPVFIALYWVLMESVELRQAPFIGWIQDLSARDPYFILPVLMGLSMFVQQRLNPAPPDPMQAKIMMFLPVVFTFMFLGFPSGLVLYWLVNNCLSILQQWWVMSRYHKKMAHRK